MGREAPDMVIVERPCCDTPLAVELPLADALHCEECSVAWTVADPDAASAVLVTVAALAA
jgi:hypothetical protein